MTPKIKSPKPVVLVVLDGWGVAPDSKGNAVTGAKLSIFNKLIEQYPATTLKASAESVGLNWGEIGNSEVGHLSLGAGRIIYQTLPRINKAIDLGDFFENKAFLNIMDKIKKDKSSLHLIGLVSSGGVHSFNGHLYALLELAKKRKVKNVYIHAFLDGRDATRNSGKGFIEELNEKIKKIKLGEIATISGRYYAMDRDNHWDRTKLAYDAIVKGESKEHYKNPIEAIESSYKKKIYDEEFLPTVITKSFDKPVATVKDGDGVIFFNFRSDRARQLTMAFTVPGFEKFERVEFFKNLNFVTMTEYDPDLPVEDIAFRKEKIENSLAKVLSEHGLKQLHIAETEKYAHVTYFFNGGAEEAYKGEDHVIIPSPPVPTYDLKPEMSTEAIKDRIKKDINEYDFIVVNFASPDMVGHTGKIKPAIKAVKKVDKCLSELVDAVLAKEGVLLITADHGNCEEMLNIQTGEISKEHSTNSVPFILVGKEWEGKTADFPDIVEGDLSLTTPSGFLADVAPTVLKIMGIKAPKEMEGRSLI
jgi:2,3-bisphosphoglycerate-independent phosphoglycerate mutase